MTFYLSQLKTHLLIRTCLETKTFSLGYHVVIILKSSPQRDVSKNEKPALLEDSKKWEELAGAAVAVKEISKVKDKTKDLNADTVCESIFTRWRSVVVSQLLSNSAMTKLRGSLK